MVQSRRSVPVWLGIGAAGIVAVVLYCFNPAEHLFYPRCFFKMTTGLDCPGCGGLRATHQLLHGHVREALALNPLFVLSLPVIAYFVARPVMKKFFALKLPQPLKVTTWAWLGGAAVIMFGVLRNLPWRAWFGS
jgi:hypothetical protein